MSDIGAELLEKIRKDFEKSCKGDGYIQAALKKVEAGTASFEDTAMLSQSLGYRLTSAIKQYVKPENLPDGRLYYNIADTILSGTLKDNYDIINSVCADVQKNPDRRLGINIKPQKADFPQERVNALVNSVSDEKADWETVRRRLDAPVRNITESFYSDYVETNADFRSKSGLDVYIVRTDHNGCCDWCRGLAGRYRYPYDVPKDVYRRHDNCTCTVTYENGKQRQDVWSKNTWTADEETLDRRKELADKKPTVLTKEQAALREREVQEKYKKKVDISGESDIIKTEEVKAMTINSIEKPIEMPIEQQHTGKGNPNAVLIFGSELNNRQKRLLESLPEFDSRITVAKNEVNMADLSALTAQTGHEFAMFTKGGERLVIRGNQSMVNLDTIQAKELADQGYRWSGHTHPGNDINCLMPSGGDKAVLLEFPQKTSVIYNSKGQFATFEKE